MGQDSEHEPRAVDLDQRLCNALEAVNDAESRSDVIDALVDHMTGDAMQDKQLLTRIEFALHLRDCLGRD